MRCMTCTLQQECQMDSWTDVNKKNEYKQCITVTTVLYCYILFATKSKEMEESMKLIINNSSMQPIYEQICTQIKNKS